MSSSSDDSSDNDSNDCIPLSDSIESFYSQLFMVDFSQPVRDSTCLVIGANGSRKKFLRRFKKRSHTILSNLHGLSIRSANAFSSPPQALCAANLHNLSNEDWNINGKRKRQNGNDSISIPASFSPNALVNIIGSTNLDHLVTDISNPQNSAAYEHALFNNKQQHTHAADNNVSDGTVIAISTNTPTTPQNSNTTTIAQQNQSLQLTSVHSSIPYVDTNLYTQKFLNMIGNPTLFAAHLRSTLLLLIATQRLRYFHPAKIHLLSLLNTCLSIIFYALSHFNTICKHFNIAECGSFNMSNLLHHFFNRNSSSKNSIFLFGHHNPLVRLFNNAEQVFFSTTLPSAFRNSPMHSNVSGALVFPLIVPPYQSDTFSHYFTQLLDAFIPTISTSTSALASNQVPLSCIPFSIFAYLGLLNSTMIATLRLIHPLAQYYYFNLNHNHIILIQSVFSFSFIPDDFWSQTLFHVSKLIPRDIHLVSQIFEEINLISIMNNKLQSMFRFPFCVEDPLSSLTTPYSSQTILFAMLVLISSILDCTNFQSSRLYTNSTLHHQFSHFALQVIYIYFILESTSPNKSQFTQFSLGNGLRLFQDILCSPKHKLSIINQPNLDINPKSSSLSPHIFFLVASLLIDHHENPGALFVCLGQLLLDYPHFATSLFFYPQFSRLASRTLDLTQSTVSHWKNNSKKVTKALLLSRLVSTAFLQFLNLNQALKYYYLQIYKAQNGTVFCDIIGTKIPVYTASSVIIEGALPDSVLQFYIPFYQGKKCLLPQQRWLNFVLAATLNSLSGQVHLDDFFLITPIDDIALGLQDCQEKNSQGNKTLSHVDIFFRSSTLLTVSPSINVIPYMAIHHNFNKTLFHTISCPHSSHILFVPILHYLELYHTFLCKPIIISTIEEISVTSGPSLEIIYGTSTLSLDIDNISKQIFQFRENGNNNNINNPPQSQPHSLSYVRLEKTPYSSSDVLFDAKQFNLTKLSQHSQFRSSLHKHAHLPPNLVLPLYYSYTEALICTIMGLSCEVNTSPSPFNIFQCGDLSASHGTIFQICEKNNPHQLNDVYHDHILNLHQYPHQLTQSYVPPIRQSTPVLFGRAPKFCDEKNSKKMQLTIEQYSAMSQHVIEMFIDLLLHERSFEFVSQIDFSDGNPLATQSTATFNYFNEHISGALSEAISQHTFSSSDATNAPPSNFLQAAQLQSSPMGKPMGNLPYFYNLTEQQQVALYETYSYDALFNARYGPYLNDRLIHAAEKESPESSQVTLSHVLNDVNTTIPNWLERSLSQSCNEMSSEPTQNEGFRFHSL